MGHAKQQAYQDGQPNAGQYTVGAGAGDNRNIAAQAGGAAANAQGKGQKIHGHRDADVHAIVAEEREKSNKMPRYPGLERFMLLEKMGDGAFSNVYRARDTQTGNEVAIKVVRKFEMNSNQVCPRHMGTARFLFICTCPLHTSDPSIEIIPTLSNTGRCSSSSGLQETRQGRGGALILSITSAYDHTAIHD